MNHSRHMKALPPASEPVKLMPTFDNELQALDWLHGEFKKGHHSNFGSVKLMGEIIELNDILDAIRFHAKLHRATGIPVPEKTPKSERLSKVLSALMASNGSAMPHEVIQPVEVRFDTPQEALDYFHNAPMTGPTTVFVEGERYEIRNMKEAEAFHQSLHELTDGKDVPAAHIPGGFDQTVQPDGTRELHKQVTSSNITKPLAKLLKAQIEASDIDTEGLEVFTTVTDAMTWLKSQAENPRDAVGLRFIVRTDTVVTLESEEQAIECYRAGNELAGLEQLAKIIKAMGGERRIEIHEV